MHKRLKDVKPGQKFVFEEDDDEYQRFGTEHDLAAVYLRVQFDASCIAQPAHAANDVPIVCIHWRSPTPIGIVRYVSGDRVVIVDNEP